MNGGGDALAECFRLPSGTHSPCRTREQWNRAGSTSITKIAEEIKNFQNNIFKMWVIYPFHLAPECLWWIQNESKDLEENYILMTYLEVPPILVSRPHRHVRPFRGRQQDLSMNRKSKLNQYRYIHWTSIKTWRSSSSWLAIFPVLGVLSTRSNRPLNTTKRTNKSQWKKDFLLTCRTRDSICPVCTFVHLYIS
jgi:hypothetical protein